MMGFRFWGIVGAAAMLLSAAGCRSDAPETYGMYNAKSRPPLPFNLPAYRDPALDREAAQLEVSPTARVPQAAGVLVVSERRELIRIGVYAKRRGKLSDNDVAYVLAVLRLGPRIANRENIALLHEWTLPILANVKTWSKEQQKLVRDPLAPICQDMGGTEKTQRMACEIVERQSQ